VEAKEYAFSVPKPAATGDGTRASSPADPVFSFHLDQGGRCACRSLALSRSVDLVERACPDSRLVGEIVCYVGGEIQHFSIHPGQYSVPGLHPAQTRESLIPQVLGGPR